jgi:Zn ribbon nucleic-acid-binding protein
MGSVIDYIECPYCGQEAHTEYWYKSGEEIINCQHCGYTRKFLITNWDEQGTDGWLPKTQIEEVVGCGTYQVKQKGHMHYECGAFTDLQASEEFARIVEQRKDELEYAEYTTFVDGILNRFILVEEQKQETNE